MTNKNPNPIVQEVIEKFETVKQMTKIFVKSNGAINGLIISGNAGTGKTHWVKEAFRETDSFDRVTYLKGSSISAPALFQKLYQTREKEQILVLDDVDLVNKSKAEVTAILDLLKGATEPTKGERILSWLRASSNALFREYHIPECFDFQGSVVWITNETQETLAKKCGSHWSAISSRFNQVPVWLDESEQVLYTLYLVEEVDMLGENCEAIEGGYPNPVIKSTADYVRENWKSMNEVSPRFAIKIADTIQNYPEDWKIYVQYAK